MHAPVASSRHGPNAWSGLQRHSDALISGAGAESTVVIVTVVAMFDDGVDAFVAVVVVVVTVGMHKLHAARHAKANLWYPGVAQKINELPSHFMGFPCNCNSWGMSSSESSQPGGLLAAVDATVVATSSVAQSTRTNAGNEKACHDVSSDGISHMYATIRCSGDPGTGTTDPRHMPFELVLLNPVHFPFASTGPHSVAISSLKNRKSSIDNCISHSMVFVTRSGSQLNSTPPFGKIGVVTVLVVVVVVVLVVVVLVVVVLVVVVIVVVVLVSVVLVPVDDVLVVVVPVLVVVELSVVVVVVVVKVSVVVVVAVVDVAVRVDVVSLRASRTVSVDYGGTNSFL